MICNLHTHTWRCQHAKPGERAYVENAIQGGIKILGFSDHTPMPYPGGYVSPAKMALDQLEDYCDTVLSLRSEYASDIEIHLGLEVEYYPALFEPLLDFLKDYPIEYFLLGQHYLGNEIGNPYCGNESDSPEALACYVDQCLAALDTGRFTYLAHPDLFHFTGDAQIYEREMARLCQGTKERGVPLEINLLGLWTHRHYPCPAFWEIAGRYACQAVIGSDAHDPEKLFMPDIEEKALAMIQRYGLSYDPAPSLVKALP